MGKGAGVLIVVVERLRAATKAGRGAAAAMRKTAGRAPVRRQRAIEAMVGGPRREVRRVEVCEAGGKKMGKCGDGQGGPRPDVGWCGGVWIRLGTRNGGIAPAKQWGGGTCPIRSAGDFGRLGLSHHWPSGSGRRVPSGRRDETLLSSSREACPR